MHTSRTISRNMGTHEKAGIMESRPGGSNNGVIAGMSYVFSPAEPQDERVTSHWEQSPPGSYPTRRAPGLPRHCLSDTEPRSRIVVGGE